jgi:hypothetical protein
MIKSDFLMNRQSVLGEQSSCAIVHELFIQQHFAD